MKDTSMTQHNVATLSLIFADVLDNAGWEVPDHFIPFLREQFSGEEKEHLLPSFQKGLSCLVREEIDSGFLSASADPFATAMLYLRGHSAALQTPEGYPIHVDFEDGFDAASVTTVKGFVSGTTLLPPINNSEVGAGCPAY